MTRHKSQNSVRTKETREKNSDKVPARASPDVYPPRILAAISIFTSSRRRPSGRHRPRPSASRSAAGGRSCRSPGRPAPSVLVGDGRSFDANAWLPCPALPRRAAPRRACLQHLSPSSTAASIKPRDREKNESRSAGVGSRRTQVDWHTHT